MYFANFKYIGIPKAHEIKITHYSKITAFLPCLNALFFNLLEKSELQCLNKRQMI